MPLAGLKSKELFQLLLGPVVFCVMEWLGPPESMPELAFHVLVITLWIAIWWITEVIPIAVTSLLPIVLYPLSGVLDISTTTASYGHRYVFLYLGGFILAMTIEKWGLHKRIALFIINLIGSSAKRIVLGFMIATAFISMWISNTASTIMILPIGLAVIKQFKSQNKESKEVEVMGKALMIGIAYSASIGGIATLIGTPPNLVLAGILEETYQVQIGFVEWMKFGLPIAIVLLVLCWLYITKMAFKIGDIVLQGKAETQSMHKALGKISYEEKIVLAVFVFTACLWVTRSLIQKVIPAIDDTIIALVAAIVFFIIPTKDNKSRILSWDECTQIPWGIILLFGGGLAIANGFTTSGLAEWIALQLTQLSGLNMFLLILIIVAAVNFLTEMTSNLATTAMLLPILASMAMAFEIHPYMIMVSATLAASCAFMLPVATPPNAIVFGSGLLRIEEMMKAGIWLNIISILLVSLITYYLLPIIWDFDKSQFPNIFR
ncbi:MAG: DASS family sodium-coupled anion symporter [Ekhidna sp.]|nr:DASS family sodium-coupled anion symporter [Ekhidna sp.]